MAPLLYWPTEDAIVFISRSALSHGVPVEWIYEMLALPVRHVRLFQAEPSVEDIRYAAGRHVSCATIAQREIPDLSRMLEVGLRQDFRYERETCRVFHAMIR